VVPTTQKNQAVSLSYGSYYGFLWASVG
jgi:hypothetical protein